MPTGRGAEGGAVTPGRPAAPPGLHTDDLGGGLLADVMVDLTGLLIAGAVFNVERTHRYLLTRQWNGRKPPLIFVMLNPATADATRLDPTVTRCQGRARRLGFGGLWVLNLYAFRSEEPKDLLTQPDPVGEHNDAYLDEYTTGLRPGSQVVAAWGSWPPGRERAREVLERLTGPRRLQLRCLAVNADGGPKHPLYVRNEQPLQPYPP
jgi:hypothetical protein